MGFILDHENSTLESVSNHLSSTWYWKQSQSAINNENVLKIVDESLNSLLRYKFLKIVDDKFIPTPLGEIVKHENTMCELIRKERKMRNKQECLS